MKYFDVKILYRVNDNSPFVSVMYFYVKRDMQQEIFLGQQLIQSWMLHSSMKPD